MEKIHFINVDKGTEESAPIKEWISMYPKSIAASVMTSLKLINIPIAFCMYGSDGCRYVVVDDEAYANKFIVNHEVGHIRGNHLKNCDQKINNVINSIEAEFEADEYAVKISGANLAMATLKDLMNRLDAKLFGTEIYSQEVSKMATRILHIQQTFLGEK